MRIPRCGDWWLGRGAAEAGTADQEGRERIFMGCVCVCVWVVGAGVDTGED